MSIHLSSLSVSEYLASDDYTVGEILPAAIIERIEMRDVPKPGKSVKDAKAVIFFRGATKGYVLTKPVGRALGKALAATKDIDKAWIGARVQFVIVGDVRRPGGTKGNAFRVHSAVHGDGQAGKVAP